jgi:uncharacterized membrane protein YhaH (DUF805 family)
VSFPAALRHGLAGLLRFGGRDARPAFWFWALAVVAVTMAASVAAVVPVVAGLSGRIERFAREHPDQATVVDRPGYHSVEVHGYHPELMPDLSGLATGLGIATAVVVALLAAAATRRLHDTGLSGAWGLLPVPFLFAGLAMMVRVFGSIAGGAPDLRLFGVLFLNNALYLLALLALVVLLSRPGQPGANRHGPPPPR